MNYMIALIVKAACASLFVKNTKKKTLQRKLQRKKVNRWN